MLLFFFAYVPALLYGAFLFRMFRGARVWSLRPAKTGYEPLISVIVAARNEACHIRNSLHRLLALDYPSCKMEIIVVDDASTDATASIVRDIAASHPNVSLMTIPESKRGAAPKKNAISQGVARSRGEIIFITDADCLVSPQWVRSLLSCFDPRTGVVFGWVGLRPERNLFWPVQQIEYVSLIAMAAGFAGAGYPTMCNANNLAFRRKAFDEVNGYAGIDTILSGDDELLMQKIVDQTNWKAAFCDSPRALNQTSPCSGVISFLQQRMRWGSKGLVYRRMWLRVMLVSIFGFYLLFWIFFFAALANPGLWIHFGLLFALKFCFDIPLAYWALKRIGQTEKLKWLLPAEFFQIFYIPLVSMAGTLGLYRWKPAKRTKCSTEAS